MAELGYWLSSEEHGPRDLVRYAVRAESVGFRRAMISDHFHPWLSREEQGEASFVWAILGGIAQATEQLHVGTGVTCPTMRTHPAIIAHAAATVAAMMPGRFSLGVGTGENLNEHIFGDRWPPYDLRNEMLQEAVKMIRKLWTGENCTFYGNFFTVEDAQIFTLPQELPRIFLAASGPKSGELAGRIGDGLIGLGPNEKVINAFRKNGGEDKPMIAKLSVIYAENEELALDTLYRVWPLIGLAGVLMPELRTVSHFDRALEMVEKDDLRATIPLGPDPNVHLGRIRELADAGFDQIIVHQIGPDQEGFFDFYERAILPYF